MRYLNIKRVEASSELPKESKSSKFTLLFVLGGVFLVLGLFIFLFGDKAIGFFNPVSVVANVADIDLEQTDGRTNVLVLGSDKRIIGNVESELTDTILVASIGHVDNNVVLISLPRDLWVEAFEGYPSKINAVYALGGADQLGNVVEEVLGIPIHYYSVVGFDLFRDVVDILGGVEVVIDTPFTDHYFPIEGKENAPLDERYETIHFDAGVQVLDGDLALKYVRSRKGDNNEGTDFARSKRQQKVIMAIKEKILSVETLINPKRLKELYDLYRNNIDTNITFSTVQQFYLLSQKIEFEKVRTVVLDDRSAAVEGGLLYAPIDTSLYGGSYVLIPRAGNFSQIHAYVQKYLFEQ